MKTLTSTTIKISDQALKKGVVLLDLGKYQEMQVPTYYLTGQAAEDADKLVEEGLREHREGKTIKASSVREAMSIYETRKNRRD